MSGEITLSSLRDELMGSVVAYKDAFQKQLDEIKVKGYADPETKESLAKHALRMDTLEARLKAPGATGMPQLSKTLGAMFIESEQFKAFGERGWHKGGAAMKLKSCFPEYFAKTTITTGTVGSAVDQATRQPGIIEQGRQELRLRDLIPSIPLNSASYEFIQETGFTNAASPQVEGNAKSESALTFTVQTVTAKTLAHWVPATRQVLDDMADLMDFIENTLMYGLKLEEEGQILSGDGTGQNLNGLITQATAYDAAGRNVSGDTYLDKLSHAETQVKVAKYMPDAYVLNPNDAEKVRLIKTNEGTSANNGQYVMGSPADMTVRRAWTLPIVESLSISEGFFLVGSFRRGARILDRMQSVIDISTEHANFFTENKVAIRAEERLALAVTRPESFVYGAF
jgi:HK97 family phage major capsid protein